MEKYNLDIKSDINQLEIIKNKEIDKVIKNAKEEEDSVSNNLSNIFENIKNEVCETGEGICRIDYDDVIKGPKFKYRDIHIIVEKRGDDTVINVEWKKTKINSRFDRNSTETFTCKKDKNGNLYRNEDGMTELEFWTNNLSEILSVVKSIKGIQYEEDLDE